jgi:hypothetical protein
MPGELGHVALAHACAPEVGLPPRDHVAHAAHLVDGRLPPESLRVFLAILVIGMQLANL